MGWFDDQIRTRKYNDNQDFDRSFRNIAMAVTGDKSIAYELEDEEIAQGTIDRIMQYYRVKKKEGIKKASTFEEMMAYSFHSSGIMYRRVELEKGWRRDAFGAMIGFLEGDDTPVALIPWGALHYRYYDVNRRKYVVIHRGNEDSFSKDAYVFYRPFPLKKMGIIDLLKYIFSVMERFDKILVALLTLLITLIGMLTPKLNLFLFNDVINSEDYSLLIVTGVFLLSVSIGSLMFNAVKSLISARIDTKMSISVEAATMMRILSLPAGFFKDYSSGELSSRASNVNSLCTTLVSVVFNTGLTSLFSLLYITQIFAYAPGLVVPALIIILVTVGFSVVSSLLQMNLMKEQLLIDSKENGMSYALVSGIEKVKLTGAEKRAFARWGNLYAKSAKIRYNPPLLIKINAAISTAISLIGTIIMYNQAIVTGVSSAEYYAFNTAYGLVSGAFMSLFSIALTAANLRPTLEMAEPILKAVPEISENKEVLSKISGGIELVNLSFKYKENSPIILDDISLKINPGQYVAIVGKTGCGKSTLVRLLLGFEQPTRGSIFYDGKDINSVDLRSLRRNIGVVTQNGKLVAGDIYSNIVLAAPYLTLDEAWEAARIAGIDEDIKLMPMGMNTIISEGGKGISGGQKQRLMIARAVASKPKLLIFDEATSALDNITQKKVSDALDAMKCTRIVIAHRLSTIQQCDRILVLDGGSIVEDGTYEELLKREGFFADLVSRQRVE